jgi:hypothetical protein
MATDTLIAKGGTVIQHGPLNDRVYLMKLGPSHMQFSFEEAEALAREHGYSKIVAKVPPSAREVYAGGGYAIEAVLPGFFNGREDCYFLPGTSIPDGGKFLTLTSSGMCSRSPSPVHEAPILPSSPRV